MEGNKPTLYTQTDNGRHRALLKVPAFFEVITGDWQPTDYEALQNLFDKVQAVQNELAKGIADIQQAVTYISSKEARDD